MFYDERIEYERGRISRNCIIISVIGAFIYGALNLTNILIGIENPRAHHFLHIGIEIFIILSGIICLTVGAFKAKSSRDERTLAERNIFYNRAGMIHLRMTLAIWAILMPFAAAYPLPSINFSAMPYDYGLALLILPIVTYIVYSFKKHEIYFNYSILENEHYYNCVLKNIRKFGLRMLGLFGISLFGLLICISKIKIYILVLIISYIFIYIFIFTISSLLYLLLSALEKSSYDNQTKLISKATTVSFITSTALTVVCSAISVKVMAYINSLNKSDMNMNIPIGTLIARLDYLISYINFFITLALILSITYFCYEYSRAKQNRILSASCGAILVLKGCKEFFSACYRIIQITVSTVIHSNWDKYNDIYLERRLVELYLYLTYFIAFSEIIATILIIIALVRDKTIVKGNIAAIPVLAALCCIALFLITQLNFTEFSYFSNALSAVITVYCAVLIALIGRKNTPYSDK